MRINYFNKKVIALLIAICILVIIPASFAHEDIALNQSETLSLDEDTNAISEEHSIIYVDSTYEGDDGTGSADKPVRTISEGLNLVSDNGTIYLTGRFAGDGNSNITLDNTPNNINFIGTGEAVIDGNHTTSFLVVNEGKYIFNNISFINNLKDEEGQFGGAICNGELGDLTFNNCLFENNIAFGVNNTNGGAIDNSGKLTIRDCKFINNTAVNTNSSGFRKNSADGGAISNLGKIYIYNTLFKENKALRNGGAIRTQDRATAYIENCVFDGNMAAYHESGGTFGGAIYGWDCSMDIYATTFKNNRVIDISGYGAQGGAISYDRSSGKMNIQSCEFINNTAEGVGLVSGQSIFMGGSASINYCVIDTSIYSGSQDVNLNYNWWVVNDTKITDLIEMLPSSAKIKTFAKLEVAFDGDEIKTGAVIPIFVKLCWNGSENQKDITLIPTRTVYLESNCGNLANDTGIMTNGMINTTVTLNTTDNPLIIANVDGVIVKFDFTNKQSGESSELVAVCRNITEGENALLLLTYNYGINGICLVDVGSYKYYGEFVNGKANVTIPNLKAGKYEASIKYYNDNSINATAVIKVAPNSNSGVTNQTGTKIAVNPSFDFNACDIKAGEKGGYLTFTLTDANGKPLANETVQVALNGAIKDAITNDEGIGKLQANIAVANSYTCAISFSGDEIHAASPLGMTKVIVSKKKTTISASAKTFKVKSKTKQISVTLKTVKNAFDGKTYLYKGKKLTLTVNGKTYTAKTNAKGVAKFSLKLTKKGKFTTKIKFAGDSTYKASSKTVKITVK